MLVCKLRKLQVALAVTCLASAAYAQAPSPAPPADDAAALAQQLANPVASLISVPFQNNWDFGYGPDDDGWRWTLNVQPVIPISLTGDWNLISRTILPVIYQDDLFPGAGDQAGLGDTLQSFFLSPVESGPLGLIWGVGPILLLPTGTDDLLGSEKWGFRPDRGRAQAERALDLRDARQPRLVLHRRRRPRRRLRHLPPALRELHDEACDELRAQHRVHLRLGGRGVDRAAERRRAAALQDRRAANPGRDLGPLVSRVARRRARLGPAPADHVAIPTMSESGSRGGSRLRSSRWRDTLTIHRSQSAEGRAVVLCRRIHTGSTHSKRAGRRQISWLSRSESRFDSRPPSGAGTGPLLKIAVSNRIEHELPRAAAAKSRS